MPKEITPSCQECYRWAIELDSDGNTKEGVGFCEVAYQETACNNICQAFVYKKDARLLQEIKALPKNSIY